jgi:multidrug efflux pump subunit AcrA (membrane-fusion protein)
MKKKKKRRARLIIILVVIALVIALAIVVLQPLLTGGTDSSENATTVTRTATVERGTIETIVAGSGSLGSDSVVDIIIPSGLTMETIYVSENDLVSAGEVLATIDPRSIADAIDTVLSELDAIDRSLRQASSDTNDATIETDVGGRVKQIFAETGDDVQSVMAEMGALAIISADGRMRVSFEADSLGDLAVGDRVTVTLADGSTSRGTIENTNGNCVVTLSDDGPQVGEAVTISATDGTVLGSGTLEINVPISIRGNAGTIKSVDVSENRRVSSGASIFTLSESVAALNYQSQIATKEELEDMYWLLLSYSRTNSIIAPSSGMVSSINVSYNGNLANPSINDSHVVPMNPVNANGLSSDTTADLGIAAMPLSYTATDANYKNDVVFLSTDALFETTDEDNTDDSELTTISGEIQIFINNPVTGNTPQSTIMPGRGYTGSIIWQPPNMIRFQESTAYTATVTLAADEGYKFDEATTPVVVGGQIAPETINRETEFALIFSVSFAPTSPAMTGNDPGNQIPGGGGTQMPGGGDNQIQGGGSNQAPGGGQTSQPPQGSVPSGDNTASIGSGASPSSDITAMTTAFSIMTNDIIILTAHIDELDILSLEQGQAASVVLDALPDETFIGEVIRISNIGTSQSGVTTYPITIQINVPEGLAVKIGMNSSATIITGSTDENALIIPMSALQEFGGESFVMIANEETSGEMQASGSFPFGERRIVTTGLSDGNYVEIIEGLSEGDIVVYLEIVDSANQQSFGFGGGGFGGRGFSGGGGMPPGQ